MFSIYKTAKFQTQFHKKTYKKDYFEQATQKVEDIFYLCRLK
jgi:hypothetical protein